MTTLRDRYLATIDALVEMTLAGRVRSKEQIYRRLERDLEAGTGEIFEACLSDRLTQFEAESGTKAARKVRATTTIASEFDRWQQDNRDSGDIQRTITALRQAEPGDRLVTIMQAIDPNREHAWNVPQIQQFAQKLTDELSTSADNPQQLIQLGAGLIDGLKSYRELESVIISWIYDRATQNIGFEEAQPRVSPWATWAKQSSNPMITELFHTIDQGRPVLDYIAQCRDLDERTWLELAIVLQGLQRGLVAWFDKQPYSLDMGKQVASSAFLIFGACGDKSPKGSRDRAEPTSVMPASPFHYKSCDPLPVAIPFRSMAASLPPLAGTICATP
ncbi:MAG: hypothetical protein HC795_00460 [Coleofasciculaceae cyanobacterium RL_1_1]|nr:hypothetical protein [Coleofasciculaceae cyanobacterium RL_1_1]